MKQDNSVTSGTTSPLFSNYYSSESSDDEVLWLSSPPGKLFRGSPAAKKMKSITPQMTHQVPQQQSQFSRSGKKIWPCRPRKSSSKSTQNGQEISDNGNFNDREQADNNVSLFLYDEPLFRLENKMKDEGDIPETDEERGYRRQQQEASRQQKALRRQQQQEEQQQEEQAYRQQQALILRRQQQHIPKTRHAEKPGAP